MRVASNFGGKDRRVTGYTSGYSEVRNSGYFGLLPSHDNEFSEKLLAKMEILGCCCSSEVNKELYKSPE